MWALGLALTFPVTTRIEFKNGICGSVWVHEGDDGFIDKSLSCQYNPTDEEISKFTRTEDFCRGFFKEFKTNISLSLVNERLDRCACSKGEEYQKVKKPVGDIDVGDECWRQNVLVTSLRCW